jgi:hypothetical protein
MGLRLKFNLVLLGIPVETTDVLPATPSFVV